MDAARRGTEKLPIIFERATLDPNDLPKRSRYQPDDVIAKITLRAGKHQILAVNQKFIVS